MGKEVLGCTAGSASITYNSRVVDRILCPCVICPGCGAWVVFREQTLGGNSNNDESLSAICPVPDCGKEFAFYRGETQVFELPISLFERRHFYRSELG
jgi:hypothetical protein